MRESTVMRVLRNYREDLFQEARILFPGFPYEIEQELAAPLVRVQREMSEDMNHT